MTEERDELQGDPDTPSAADEPDAVEAPPTEDDEANGRGVTVPQGEDRGITVPQKATGGSRSPRGDAAEGSDES